MHIPRWLFLSHLLLVQAQQPRSTVSIASAVKALGGHNCLGHCLWGSLWNMGWAMSCASPTLNNCYCATSSGAEITASNWISSCATENCAAGDRTADISSMASIYASYCMGAGLTQIGATKWFDPSKPTSTVFTNPQQETTHETSTEIVTRTISGGTTRDFSAAPADKTGIPTEHKDSKEDPGSQILLPLGLGLGLGLGIPLVLAIIAIIVLAGRMQLQNRGGASAMMKPPTSEVQQAEIEDRHASIMVQKLSQQVSQLRDQPDSGTPQQQSSGWIDPVSANLIASQPYLGSTQLEMGAEEILPRA